MENYIINKNTLMIYPKYNGSIIIEKNKEYNSLLFPYEIVNNSCKYYGSSLKGRIDSTRYLMNIKYKCPIIISEINKIIMFPTKSYNINDCIYINHNAIKNYYKLNNKLKIILINNKEYDILISKYIIINQILKCSQLEHILNNKKS